MDIFMYIYMDIYIYMIYIYGYMIYIYGYMIYMVTFTIPQMLASQALESLISTTETLRTSVTSTRRRKVRSASR